MGGVDDVLLVGGDDHSGVVGFRDCGRWKYLMLDIAVVGGRWVGTGVCKPPPHG